MLPLALPCVALTPHPSPHRPQIHWFSIINSCVTVLLLTGFLATILMRVLKADFVKFSRGDNEMGAWTLSRSKGAAYGASGCCTFLAYTYRPHRTHTKRTHPPTHTHTHTHRHTHTHTQNCCAPPQIK